VTVPFGSVIWVGASHSACQVVVTAPSGFVAISGWRPSSVSFVIVVSAPSSLFTYLS
jgi:hypothetical protein